MNRDTIAQMYACLQAEEPCVISTQILKLVAEILSKVADFELTQNDATCVESAQNADIYSSLESREEGREENKALPRKASTLKPAGAREAFEEFWNAYPKRINKQSAFRKFEHLLKLGVEQKRIIDAVHAYAKNTQATEKQFIKSPDVWLNKGCYDDELPFANGRSIAMSSPAEGITNLVFVKQDTPQWDAWAALWREKKGKAPPTHNGGWHFPTEWPPDHAQ